MKPRIYPFEPFPTLSTSRMSLRKMEESDAADVLALRSHPQLIEFVDRPLLKQIKEADFFIFEREIRPHEIESLYLRGLGYNNEN